MLHKHIERVPSRYLDPCTGLACLIFVPIFKTMTGMPPYIGMLAGLSVMWLLTVLALPSPLSR